MIVSVITVLLVTGLLVFLGFKRPVLALLIVPVACGVCISSALLASDSAARATLLLASPGMLLAVLISSVLSKSDLQPAPKVKTVGKWLIPGFALLLLAATAVIAAMNLPSFSFLIVAMLVCVIGLTGAAINFGITFSKSTAAYVISTIGASMRQNLPLAMSLESAAGIRNDAQAKTLRAISGWLAQGYTLSESVKRGYPKCPRYAATMITAAERINQLPQAFKSIEADIAAKSEENKKIEPVSLFYPLVLVLVIGFFVWGILTFIMPQLHMILIEMGGEESMPACTNFLMDIFGFFVDESGVLFFTILGLVVFVALPYCIYMRFHRREPQKPRISSQVGDWFKWRLPVVRSLERNNSMLRVAEMIRLSLNAGCTVNDAIANTLDLDINNCLRKRIRKWLARVEKGEDISKAANASGTGRGLAWAFDKNANRDDAPTALEILESFYRLNYNYRANLARFIAEPTVTLIMASLVGFVVYAIYSAPVAIIYHATEAVYP